MITYISQIPYGAILITAGVIWILYMGFYKIKHKCTMSLSQAIKSGVSIAYIVLFITLYATPASYRPAREGPYLILQLIPFNTIKYSNYISTFGNMLMLLFVPILLYLNLNSLKKTCIFAVLIPVLIEPGQFIIDWLTRFPNFVVDVDDFMLQFAGSMIGLLLILLFRKMVKRQRIYLCERGKKTWKEIIQ